MTRITEFPGISSDKIVKIILFKPICVNKGNYYFFHDNNKLIMILFFCVINTEIKAVIRKCYILTAAQLSNYFIERNKSEYS